MTNFVCDACGNICTENEILSADNPFLPGRKVRYCPNCKEAGTLSLKCDVDGCNEAVFTSWRHGERYRYTCMNHTFAPV